VTATALHIAMVVGLLVGMFGALKLYERFLHPHPELLRKLMHVGMGLVVISFPWVFHGEQWPVLLLSASSMVLLLAVKYVPRLRDGIGTVLTGVNRASLGEICFPIAVGTLWILSRQDKFLFVVPMIILTLADAVAALVGITYGKVRYLTSDGFKSAEGSIAFFSIAFLSVHVPLLLFTNCGRAESLLLGLIIGILSTLLEAIAARGLDNLLIPLGTFAFLKLYEHATPHALLIRVAATVLLLVFALSWRQRSSLNDSALMACALFGYGAAMLGGPLWLIGPSILFLIHVWRWPRPDAGRVHSVSAVVAVTLAALFWLGLQVAYGGKLRFFVPYAVSFGAHLAIIGVSQIPIRTAPCSPARRVLMSILAGIAVFSAQITPAILFCSSSLHPGQIVLIFLIGAAGVVIATAGFLVLVPYLYGPRGSDNMIHVAGFTTALMGSSLAVTAEIALRIVS
jgi:phytol kinase